MEEKDAASFDKKLTTYPTASEPISPHLLTNQSEKNVLVYKEDLSYTGVSGFNHSIHRSVVYIDERQHLRRIHLIFVPDVVDMEPGNVHASTNDETSLQLKEVFRPHYQSNHPNDTQACADPSFVKPADPTLRSSDFILEFTRERRIMCNFLQILSRDGWECRFYGNFQQLSCQAVPRGLSWTKKARSGLFMIWFMPGRGHLRYFFRLGISDFQRFGYPWLMVKGPLRAMDYELLQSKIQFQSPECWKGHLLQLFPDPKPVRRTKNCGPNATFSLAEKDPRTYTWKITLNDRDQRNDVANVFLRS
ncbi:MAG: hypothetical protein Q9162_003938 [Coniocarpon cinnabarinum]